MRAGKLNIFLLILFYCGNSNARVERGRGRPAKPCPTPKLMNGRVIPVNKGKMMRFDCNREFILYGQKYAECNSGRWSIDTFPLCIKSGCPQHQPVDNGKIYYMNKNTSAALFCEPNYEIVGSNFAHCDGTNWDRVIGSCRETDNAPPTSCDFESESICGWTHDADHDFDFERRSGHNNRTVSLQTGPSADHTTGIPFHGHYMVINTNLEVSTKTARLISPLYKIDAEKICFEFYYHMYGTSVGTLRVYAKPESVNMQDALVSDEVTEAQNDYVVFEIKGTQGNAWKRGNGTIKQFHESFQIIIEAISGQTRLSDIAFDDVSILTDQDCSDSNEDDEKKEPEDADGVYEVESCVNRCFENATVQLFVNKTLSCSCSIDCASRESCCPDFIVVCMKDDSSQNDTISTTSVPETSSTTTSTTLTSTTTKRISTTTTSTSTSTSTPKISSTSTLPSTTPSTLSTTSTTLKTSSTTTQKVILTTRKEETPQVPQNAKSTTQSDVEEIPKKAPEEIEDEHEILPDDVLQQSHTLEKSQSENFSFILTTVVIIVSSVFLAIVAIAIVYKQYRKSTDPLNYKERSDNGGTNRADEEFSEIRYLTSDETLDFTLASPDNNATDL